MALVRHQKLTLLILWLNTLCQAWVVVPPKPTARTFIQRADVACFSTKTENDEKEKETVAERSAGNSSEVTAAPPVATENDEDEAEDDDDEYEYIEYEMLSEADYLGSEWMVGTLWDNNQKNIKETWVRLAEKDDKNLAVWGDGSEGTWSLDAASQFLAISKNFIWGKQIWAGVVDDYYFSQGTVRGWTYATPASVLGQWQAKRLGVDPEEAGTAPWFDTAEEAEGDEDSKDSEADE